LIIFMLQISVEIVAWTKSNEKKILLKNVGSSRLFFVSLQPNYKNYEITMPIKEGTLGRYILDSRKVIFLDM
jgi:hypothetical protein